MDFLEKDLEQIIYETPAEILTRRGLSMWGHKIRQPKLGSYGRCDIITVCVGSYTNYCVEIYELKNDNVDTSTFWQAVRYARGVQMWFEKFRPHDDVEIGITLVGRHVDLTNDFCYATSIFENLRVFTYQYDINGLYFKSQKGFYLKEPKFTNAKIK